MQNKLVLKISLSNPNWKDEYEKLTTAFLENLDICQKFEKSILIQTQDMNISNVQSEICCRKLQKSKH